MHVAELTRDEKVDYAFELVDAYQSRHAIVDGRHMDDAIFPLQLVKYPWAGLHIVRDYIVETLEAVPFNFRQNDMEYVIPVPYESSYVLRGWDLDFMTIFPNKVGEREFIFDNHQTELIRDASKLAIVASVIMTGDTVAAMARTVRNVNDNSELHLDLVGIVLCGQLLPENVHIFTDTDFLLTKPVANWPASECINPACISDQTQ